MPADDKLILVVDDEPRMIQFIRMNLELEGYRVLQASNGLGALDKVRDELPDLVILDGDPLEDFSLIGNRVDALFMDGKLVINNCGFKVETNGKA